MLAGSKLDSIIEAISKSLSDNNISDDEFKRILTEIERYRLMKDDIRHQYTKKKNTQMTDQQKEMFKKEFMDNILKQLNKKCIID